MNLAKASYETERLVIRSCRPDDAAVLAALMTPAISARVAAWPFPFSLDEADKIVSAHIKAGKAGKAFPAVIQQKTSGAVIGWVKIELSADDRTLAELGYWIGETYQQNGYALEASKGAIEFAFNNLGVEVIQAGAQAANKASLKLLAKLGMRRRGCETTWAPARQRHEQCDFWVLQKP